MEDDIFSSVVIMLLSSIMAGAAWKCQNDKSSGLLARCYAVEGYNLAMRELIDGRWF